MSYTLRIVRKAQKALASIPKPDRDRLISKIQSLSSDPRPPHSRKLVGRDAWRVRVGDYRVIYEIHDDVLLVLIIVIRHRKDAYSR